MKERKDAKITTIYLDRDNDDFLRCPTCPLKLSQFINAKLREYRGLTNPQQPLEIGQKSTKEMNDKIAREIHNFVTDIKINKQIYVYENLLEGRLKAIKKHTGYDLTATELKKLVEAELKKDVGKQTNL